MPWGAAGTFMAVPAVPSGVLMRLGSQRRLPGSLQPLGCGERLRFRGRAASFGQSPATVPPTPQCPQHHSAPDTTVPPSTACPCPSPSPG